MDSSKFRRIAAIVLTVAFAISILTVVFSSLSGELLQLGQESTFFSNLGFFLFVNINLIIALVLVFLVVKNLIKLLLDRRKGILGSRLRTRLVAAFVGLSLIPTVLLFLVARGIIENVLQGWFSPQVNTVLDGAFDVAEFYYRSADQRINRNLKNVSRQLIEKNPSMLSDSFDLQSAERERLQQFLEAKREEYGLYQLAIADAEAKLIAESVAGESSPTPSLAAIRNAFKGVGTVRPEQTSEQEFVRGYGPITSYVEGAGSHPSATPTKIHKKYILLVTESVSEDLTGMLSSLLSGYDDYKELRMFRQPIVSGYILTLVVVMLFIIFGAIWVGLYLAKSWSVPIAELAAGTEQVAHGNLGYKIPEVGDDELSILVRSFNKMTGDLNETTSELVQRRQYMEAVLANVGVGVISLDKSDRITTFNRAARNILSIPRDLVLPGRELREVLPTDLAADIGELVESMRDSKDRVAVDTFSTTIEGEAKHLHLTLTQLRDAEGSRSIGSVLLLDDVTALVSAQRMAAWREVARRIAHEIKNPLTPIQLSAQRVQKRFQVAVQEQPLTVEDINLIQESTEMIVKQVESLRILVNEFSRFARMPKSLLRKADINQLVQTTVEMFKQSHGNIRFCLELDEKLPQVSLDQEQMSRALVNIIDNAISAIEHSDQSNGEIVIRTSFDADLEIVQLVISDNGIGVSEEDKTRLFEPYFSTKKQGTGLGLAIVSTIVADHNGYVRVRDNYPQGAVFVIELPLSGNNLDNSDRSNPETIA